MLPYFIEEKAFPNIKYVSTHKTKGKYILILQHKNWRPSYVKNTISHSKRKTTNCA